MKNSTFRMQGFRKLAIFIATAAVLSACSKAQIVGKGDKPRIVPLTITNITPDWGPVAGGTTITITGTGFVTGTTVTIGGIECGSVQVISLTQMTCVTGSAPKAGTDVVAIVTPLTSTNDATYSYTQAIEAVGTAIASGGVFGTSGTILVRATIGAVSGVSPNNVATSPEVIKVGGLQGIIQAQNAFMTGGTPP